MPKTTVGLFEHPGLVDDVVREIESLGFPRNEVRNLKEPAAFEVTGVMSGSLPGSGRPKRRRRFTSKDCGAEEPWFSRQVQTKRWMPLRTS